MFVKEPTFFTPILIVKSEQHRIEFVTKPVQCQALTGAPVPATSLTTCWAFSRQVRKARCRQPQLHHPRPGVGIQRHPGEGRCLSAVGLLPQEAAGPGSTGPSTGSSSTNQRAWSASTPLMPTQQATLVASTQTTHSPTQARQLAQFFYVSFFYFKKS